MKLEIHLIKNKDFPQDNGFIESEQLLLYIQSYNSYTTTLGYYNFLDKQFYGKPKDWNVVAWEYVSPRLNYVRCINLLDKIDKWLSKNITLGIKYQDFIVYNSKDGKYQYRLDYGKEGFSLRLIDTEKTHGWNDYIGFIQFTSLDELITKFKKGVFDIEETNKNEKF